MQLIKNLILKYIIKKKKKTPTKKNQKANWLKKESIIAWVTLGC
jgi:hypothetical protein